MHCIYFENLSGSGLCGINAPGYSKNGNRIQIGEKYCLKCPKISSKIECSNWSDIGHPSGGKCSVGNINIDVRTCIHCLANNLCGKHLIDFAPTLPQTSSITGLGDVIAKVATSIARALNMPCVDPQTKQLRPESPCSKRRAMLNKAVPFS